MVTKPRESQMGRTSVPSRSAARWSAPAWSVLAAFGVAATIVASPAGAVTAPATTPATSLTTGTTTPQVAAAVPALSTTDQRVATMLGVRSTNKDLGSDLTGLVSDASSGQQVWSQLRRTRQLPASTTKLVTSVNALESFGPGHRFTTTVRKGSTWRRVVLVGSGDPSLSGTNLKSLAAATATAVRAKGVRRVTVLVDDSLFPRPTSAYGW